MDDSLLPKELRTKKEPAVPKKGVKVVTGETRIVKPSLKQQFRNVFCAEDLGSIKEFIIQDNLIPALQNGIYNLADQLILGTIGMMFWGKMSSKSKGRNYRRRATGNEYWEPEYSYDRGYPSEDRCRGRRDSTYRQRVSSSVLRPIAAATYNDADAVLQELIACLEQYGRVPVSLYYDAFGVSNRPWTDENWGWTSLADAKIVPARGGGFIIDLPDPEAI